MSPLFVLFIGLTSSHASPALETLLPRVLDGVLRGIQFFQSDYANINVDGLFGVRLGQGQVEEALRECESRKCPEELVHVLQQFSRNLKSVGEKAMPYIEQASPDYFARFVDVIATPYILGYKPTLFTGLDEVELGTKKEYSEEAGDRCYARVLGTYKENNSYIPRCNVTQSCLNLMTEKNTQRYVITHQLLYFIAIEHTGCSDKLNSQHLSLDATGIRKIEDSLCKGIVKEASMLAGEGAVQVGSQDLFLEQSVLCGCLGYEDILQPKYIDMVLKMQSRDGCFKMMPDLLSGSLNQGSGRKLLREQYMRDGCLSHKSGLGFGTLGLYLRYLVRQLF